MSRLGRIAWIVAMAVTVVLLAQPVRAEVTAQQVRDAIDSGVRFLKRYQSKDRGNWPEYDAQPGGLTSLCTLALLNAGVPPEDPSIQRSLAYLRGLGKPEMVYSTALQTMVFCNAEPEKDRILISRNVKWLESVQVTSGGRKGSWAYSGRKGKGDNSNTQFALLALHEADRVGVPAAEPTWRLALRYWLDVQKPDGSWGYFENQPSTGSMTCAGIASVVIASGKLTAGDAQEVDGSIRCCGAVDEDNAAERGLIWLGKKFSVTSNPSGLIGGESLGETWLLYYLYAVERVGRLSGRRFIGRHDWYREGAEMLVHRQNRLNGSWEGIGRAEGNKLVGTSLALLFLSKGRRPVVVARLKHGDGEDWNQHQAGLHNLTRYVERQWKRDLTWQTIDARAATLENLMETPVLLISGREALRLSAEQEENLRDYINQGGFLFAEACDGEGCDGKAFHQSFLALMERLFPESKLRLLPPDHPVWFAQQKVDPDYVRPLYGIDACCRTSVVYCPSTLTCYWELGNPRRILQPGAMSKADRQIDASLRIGANVLAYATNRELKDKLERPQLAVSDADPDRASRGTLNIPKLGHGGGSDDAPAALLNMLRIVSEQTGTEVALQRQMITPGDPGLFEYPIVFMHGRRGFRYSATERKALAQFVERGGFVFADSICASPQFSRAFRSQWEAILPNHRLVRISTDHPIFSRAFRGYDIGQVTVRDPKTRAAGKDPLEARLTKVTPLLEGIEIDGRLAVVFSPYDISCALENHASLECKGYIKQDAARIAVNVLLYALQN